LPKNLRIRLRPISVLAIGDLAPWFKADRASGAEDAGSALRRARRRVKLASV